MYKKFLLCYKKCVTEKIDDKGCNLLNFNLLTVLLSILFNKLPFYASAFSLFSVSAMKTYNVEASLSVELYIVCSSQ